MRNPIPTPPQKKEIKQIVTKETIQIVIEETIYNTTIQVTPSVPLFPCDHLCTGLIINSLVICIFILASYIVILHVYHQQARSQR